MRSVLAISLLSLAVFPVRAEGVRVNVVDPRPFGYIIGDTLERIVAVEFDRGTPQELVSSSLPRPGPLAYWLDLVSVERTADQGSTSQTIRLVYQTFYSPLEPKRLELPGLKVSFRNTAPSAPAGLDTRDIRPFSFLMSPVREISPPKSDDGTLLLRPDAAPAYFKTGRMRTLILTWLAVAALAGAGLLWHHALWPFSRRPGRPFSRAAREIGAFSGESDEILKRHLLALHRAIDETVGERVLASDLGQFTHAHQNFAGSSSALARFFESSRHAFFRNDLAAARRTLSERDIADLAETLQRQERGGR